MLKLSLFFHMLHTTKTLRIMTIRITAFDIIKMTLSITYTFHDKVKNVLFHSNTQLNTFYRSSRRP
jgi:hypothetical protein